MVSIKWIILLFTIWLNPVFTEAQDKVTDFPEDFVGDWIGDLKIYGSKGLKQIIPMELIIEPIDSIRYTWSLIYGEDKEAGLRPYELIVVDKELGHYATDEKNSIVLDGYVLGGKFYEEFEVMGSLLLMSIEKRDDIIIFEIVVSKYESIQTTGDTIIREEKIPPVQSFKMTTRQVAELKRKVD